jgi:RHS repeat-associated protein
MEADDEVKGEKNSYDFGARMYDPRIGRWLSRDALAGKYAPISPYVFVGNMPVIAIDPDGKRIIILNKEALDAIKLTLTPQESSFVEIDKNGEINHEKLIEGLNSIGLEKVGSNFNSLLEISKSSDIVEVSVSQTYERVSGEISFPSEVQNDYNDTWQYQYSGAFDFTGEVRIDGVKYNYEQFKEKYDKEKMGPGAPTIGGDQGITQIPSQFIKTDLDKIALEAALKAGGGDNDDNLANRRVTVNKASYDITKNTAIKTIAHELYGHALFSILGKSAFHHAKRSDNQELENQIKISVNEADTNYKLH